MMSIKQYFQDFRKRISTEHKTIVPSQIPHNHQQRNPTPNKHLHTQTSIHQFADQHSPLLTHSYHQHIGDILDEQKPDHILRIYIQNINGIQIDNNGGELNTIATEMCRIRADIIALIETNVDNTNFTIKDTIHKTLRKYNFHFKFGLSGTDIPTATYFKPGGLLSWTQGNCTGRVKQCSNDPLGRWTHWQLNGAATNIHLIFVYQVCINTANTTSLNTMTAFSQQVSILKLQQRDNCEQPRYHFIQDLKELLSKITSHPTYELMIVGDFNEEFGVDNRGITTIANTFRLHDLFYEKTGESTFNTYARGRRRIDYALCTKGMMDSTLAAGYEPFHHRLSSDHRGMYIDIDTHSLFGNKTSPLAPAQARGIHSANRKTNRVYMDAMYAHLNSNNIEKLQLQLSEASELDIELAEKIDTLLTQAARCAEKKAQKPTRPPQSHELRQARLKYNAARKLLYMFRNHPNDHTNIKLLITTNPHLPQLQNKQQCVALIRDIRRHIKQISKTEAVRFAKQLEQEILDAEIDNDVKRIAALKNLRKVQDTKMMFTKLRKYRNLDTNHILTSIKVPSNHTADPKTCKEWTEITEPAKINEFILKRNQHHFGQAKGTPFTVEPLSSQIPFTGIGEFSDLILDGQYDDSELPDITSLFVRSLQRRLLPTQDKPTIHLEAFKSKIRTWKETTSTSPSGIHLGHYHALVKPHDIPTSKTEEYADIELKREFLLHLRLQLINYALQHGYSYNRWKQIVNVMLLKKPGDIRIHRLRVIHIYEADYNLVLSMCWRNAIHDAEDNAILNEGQFGGRPGRTAHDPVFIEEQVQEYSRLTRYTSIKFANDATACYDRIIPSLASIASQAYGTDKSVCSVMTQTLLEAKYKLKTSLGLSDKSYKHSADSPIYGSGQGSGNSPVIWVFLSSILFDCHNQAAHGARFHSIDNTLNMSLSIIGFVDDSTGYCNAKSPVETIQQTFQNMQHDAELWNNLLWQSGGDLELSKCLYHVSEYNFTPRGEPVLHNDFNSMKISVPSNTETCNLVINRKSPFTDHETLGCFKSPSGNQTQQLLALREKSNKHLKIVLSRPLQRQEAWTYYFAIYLPSIGYCLPVSHFTENALINLQYKPTRALLAKAGFNRNTKKAIVFGPKALGGLDWHSLYDIQGVGQVTLYLKHWRTRTFISQLLHINFTWMMAQAGTSFSPLENPHARLPHLETKWTSSLRTYLCTFDGSISINVAHCNTPQRKNDQCIMDIVISANTFKPYEIRQINYCRLYLQAITLSDITCAAGTHVRPEVRRGDKLITSSVSQWNHFKQERPDEVSWRTWRRACNLFSHKDGTLHTNLTDWLYPPDKLRQRWVSYHENSTKTLYIRFQDKYVTHKPTPEDIYYSTGNSTDYLPTSCVPVDVLPVGLNWRLKQPVHIREIITTASPSDFQQFLRQQPPWSHTLHFDLHLRVSIYSIIESIENDTVIVTSDGSVSDIGIGTFGWVAALSSGQRLLTCAGWAYGCSPGSSMRAEAYGFLSWVQFLNLLHKYHTIQWPEYLQLYQYTDSESLLIRINKLQMQEIPPPNMTLLEDWDIISMIVDILNQLPNYEIHHVKGHQDDNEQVTELPLPAQLNVEADHLAGSMHRLQHPPDISTVIQFPTNPAQLNIANTTCNGKYSSRIRRARHGPALEQYIMERQSLTEHQFQTINQKALSTVLATMSPRNPILIKLVHSHLPLNTVTSRYDKSTTAVCPGCAREIEDFVHHFQCDNTDLVQSRKNLLQKLRSTCDHISSDPSLRDTLLYGLERFFGNQPSPPSSLNETVYETQSEVGWIKILQGRFMNIWTDLQQKHYATEQKTKHNGQTWTTTMIKVIFSWYVSYWKLRNACKHGADVTQQATLQKTRILEEMRSVYALKEQVLARDRSIFFDSFDDHVQHKTTNQMKNWLAVWRPTIIQSVKHAKSWAVKGVRTINHYFQFQPD